MFSTLLRRFSRASRPSPQVGDISGTIQRALQQAGLLPPHPVEATPAPAPPLRRARARPAAASQTSDPATPATLGTDDFTTHAFVTAAGRRTYKLFTPPASTEGLHPLLVMLHGCTQDPDDFATGTRMNALARASGAFVLYPMQSASDNPQRCWNWFRPGDQHRDAGEPASIAAITREILHLHAVDPDRVYVAGLSAGGAMAGILAREFPELYAAVGIHSGLPAGAASSMVSALATMRNGSPKRPERARFRSPAALIVFHGDCDTTVNPRNADLVIASRRVAEAGVVARGIEGRAYTVTTYAGGNGHSAAEHWTVHGAGHAWSGGDAGGSHSDPLGPDASREMMRFFLANPRPAS